jgi:hypothetical protein
MGWRPTPGHVVRAGPGRARGFPGRVVFGLCRFSQLSGGPPFTSQMDIYTSWLVSDADFFWEKSIVGWWLISQTDKTSSDFSHFPGSRVLVHLQLFLIYILMLFFSSFGCGCKGTGSSGCVLGWGLLSHAYESRHVKNGFLYPYNCTLKEHKKWMVKMKRVRL